MQLRTHICLLAVLAFSSLSAARFDVALRETTGDYSGSITAEYAAPTMNVIKATPPIRITVPNQSLTYRIVTEGSANADWWFVGQKFLTFDGACWWNGDSNAIQQVKLTTTITDLDHGHVYQLVSVLNRNGSNWGRDLEFIQPTKNIRWDDKIELTTGPTGTITEWLATRHTMDMMQMVPEPASILAIAFGVAAIAIRRRIR